jgi:undecaprenyl-diphosphatase
MSMVFSVEIEHEVAGEGRLESLLASLDAHEVEVVARIAEHARRVRLLRVARTATWLGNGWLYPLMSALLYLTRRIDAPLVLLASSSLSLATAFTFYPWLKRIVARARPCDYEPSLATAPEPLDQYSCPSGHAMTAAAYAVSVLFAIPETALVLIPVCALVSWSRVALGHHYVSDVLIGTTLGALTALSVGTFFY